MKIFETFVRALLTIAFIGLVISALLAAVVEQVNKQALS